MNSTTTSTLDDVSSVIVKAIAGGHLPSVAEAIVKQTELADMVFPGSDTIWMYTHQSMHNPHLAFSQSWCWQVCYISMEELRWWPLSESPHLVACSLLNSYSQLQWSPQQEGKQCPSPWSLHDCRYSLEGTEEGNLWGAISSLFLYSSHVDKQVGNCKIKKSFIV